MPGLKIFFPLSEFRNLPRRRLIGDILEGSVYPQLDSRDQFCLTGLRFPEQGAPVVVIPQQQIECR